MTGSNALQFVAMLLFWCTSTSWQLHTHRPSCGSPLHMSHSTPDPALEVVAFDSINNFRRALPGTSLPIYRCAALDNASPTDASRLDPLTTIIGTARDHNHQQPAVKW
jgi:hypothetical protein